MFVEIKDRIKILIENFCQLNSCSAINVGEAKKKDLKSAFA